MTVNNGTTSAPGEFNRAKVMTRIEGEVNGMRTDYELEHLGLTFDDGNNRCFFHD